MITSAQLGSTSQKARRPSTVLWEEAILWGRHPRAQNALPDAQRVSTCTTPCWCSLFDYEWPTCLFFGTVCSAHSASKVQCPLLCMSHACRVHVACMSRACRVHVTTPLPVALAGSVPSVRTAVVGLASRHMLSRTRPCLCVPERAELRDGHLSEQAYRMSTATGWRHVAPLARVAKW